MKTSVRRGPLAAVALINAVMLCATAALSHEPSSGQQRAAALERSSKPHVQIASSGVVWVVVPSSAGDGSTSAEAAVRTIDGKLLMGFSSDTTSGVSLPGAVARAADNSIILLAGTFHTRSTIALRAGQTLMGAGTLAVKTASGRVVHVTNGGATINGAMPDKVTVSMADNSTLTGLNVINTAVGPTLANAYGVWAVGIRKATISNNVIRATGSNAAHAVAISDSTDIAVLNNRLSGAGYFPSGLEIEDSTGIRVAGNTFGASGSPQNNHAIRIANPYVAGSFTADSTGNTIAEGKCQVSGDTDGAIGLNGGGRCPN